MDPQAAAVGGGGLNPGDAQPVEVPTTDAPASVDAGSIKQIDENKKSVEHDLSNKVAELSLSSSASASENVAPLNGEASPPAAVAAVEGAQDFKEYEESDDETDVPLFESEEQVRSLLSGVKREELLEFATKLAMKDLGAAELGQLAQAHEHHPDARKVHVRNLPFDLTEHDLKKAMNVFGKVEAHVIIKNRFSQESRGFGFVTFTKKKYATRALEAGQTPLNDQSPPIAIQAVRPRRQFFRQQHQNNHFQQQQHHHHQGGAAAAGGGAAGTESFHHQYHHPQHQQQHHQQQQQQQQQYVIPPHMLQQYAGAHAAALPPAVAAAQQGYGGYRGSRGGGGGGGRAPRRAYQQQW